jgi:hypothetical protein
LDLRKWMGPRDRLSAGGNRIRTIGPASGKVVDASSSDQTRVGRTLTLGGGAEVFPGGPDIELSVSPKDIRTSPYNLCANRSDRRQSREGDRRFESTSLQRRVRCELNSLGLAPTQAPRCRLSRRCKAGRSSVAPETPAVVITNDRCGQTGARFRRGGDRSARVP